jgi:hypothetical protein
LRARWAHPRCARSVGWRLPLAGRGILGGAVLMWARGISEFGAVVILAYNPRPSRCWCTSASPVSACRRRCR